jgi:tetratricopeptide (TPR) repeat protein
VLTDLRFGPQEWTGEELQTFVPELVRIDQDKDRRLARLAVILAEAVSVHAAATTLMETHPSEFTAIWFGAPGKANEVFPAGTDAVYEGVVSGVYRFLDMQLGRLLELAGPDAMVMIVSDRAAGEAATRSSSSGGSQGMLCAKGPGIEPDGLAFGMSLLDLAPTVLGLFGFVPAPGMAGQRVPEVCVEVPSKAVRSYEMKFDGLAEASQVASELAALEAMGYRDPVGDMKRVEAESARKRRDVHLAWVLLSQGRVGEMVPLLERMVEEDPSRADVRLYLAHAYFLSDRVPECRAICDTLEAEYPNSPLAPFVHAHLAIAEGKLTEAKKHLASGREFHGIVSGLDVAVGEAYLKLEKWDEAAEAFRWAIHADSGLATAHEGLARALLADGHTSDAAEAAMDAIRIRYDYPSAHLTLSRALKALGRDEAAANAQAIGNRLRRGRVAA